MPTADKPDTKHARATKVNELVAVIASCGRRFFSHKDRIAYIDVDARGRIWWIDDYTGRRIYTHYTRDDWRGFSHGGTLRDLVIHLRDFVRVGKRIPKHQLGPWPDWVCGGDLWGYGPAMNNVRSEAARLGITEQP